MDANKANSDSKKHDLEKSSTEADAALTDNMGHRISDDQNSLRAGPRGPTLMEDFHFREKFITLTTSVFLSA